MSNGRAIVRAAVALVVSGLVPACYAEAQPVVVTSAGYVEGGYAPAYYDGYVVYYDDIGRPYYYDRGAVVWIAPSSPYYPGLTHHWRVYGPHYRSWYDHYGYRYRDYRGAPGYHSYHGYPGGGGHHH
jgi:hypothetical protein